LNIKGQHVTIDDAKLKFELDFYGLYIKFIYTSCIKKILFKSSSFLTTIDLVGNEAQIRKKGNFMKNVDQKTSRFCQKFGKTNATKNLS